MIDMFIHPILNPDEGELFDLSHIQWPKWVSESIELMEQNSVSAAGVCIMDNSVLCQDHFLDAIDKKDTAQRLWFTLMMDFRAQDPLSIVKLASDIGFKGITFHSYLQEIQPSDYPLVVEIAKYANSLSMFTGLCTAFGSKKIYDFQSLPLAVEILKQVSSPIVLYHSGGARILEALLLCEMWPNLFLETSFSLSYWLNSSIELDIAFSIKKLGAHRFMFGSDSPFISLRKAIDDHLYFFERHGFSEVERNLIMGDSAHNFFSHINQLPS
jgi:predicted TIM-barrel fold metal-dependent hydrolase